jgi:hypothetical protein
MNFFNNIFDTLLNNIIKLKVIYGIYFEENFINIVIISINIIKLYKF